MKTLTKVKLINWHTFSNEEFEIYKNALITGENGTGKSTILDAIQYVLTAGKWYNIKICKIMANCLHCIRQQISELKVEERKWRKAERKKTCRNL